MIHIRKLNGQIEEFEEAKIRRSLLNAGAGHNIAHEILGKLRRKLYDGITTKEVFRFVFHELRRYTPTLADKFDLKNAILRMGPAGFAFEEYIAQILKSKGYTTLTDQQVRGIYISHEIDVVAEKPGEKLMVECKHHLQPWNGCHIQTALYVWARFLEVKKYFTQPMLVTNTTFSESIIRYARGVGLRLMGWKYPKGDSLEENIERYKLYPITLLRSLEPETLSILLDRKVVLLKTLAQLSLPELSQILQLPPAKVKTISEEAQELCGINQIHI